VSLTAVDLFACIIAALAASFGGFHALRVNAASSRFSIATELLTFQTTQCGVDLLPSAILIVWNF